MPLRRSAGLARDETAEATYVSANRRARAGATGRGAGKASSGRAVRVRPGPGVRATARPAGAGVAQAARPGRSGVSRSALRLQSTPPPFVFDFVKASSNKAGQISSDRPIVLTGEVSEHLILSGTQLARNGLGRIQLLGGHMLPPKTQVIRRLDNRRNSYVVGNVKPFSANPCGAKDRVRPEFDLTGLVIVQQRRVQNLGARRRVSLERHKPLERMGRVADLPKALFGADYVDPGRPAYFSVKEFSISSRIAFDRFGTSSRRPRHASTFRTRLGGITSCILDGLTEEVCASGWSIGLIFLLIFGHLPHNSLDMQLVCSLRLVCSQHKGHTT